MAFSKKTWLDRIAEYPTRRRLKKSDGTDEIVTVSREEGAISQEGDAFSAANMNDLEDRVASEFNSLNIKMELVQSHVGMIIQSSTLDTEAKVIAIYGGTSWSKIEGRFLLGATSSYAANSTGGESAHRLTINEMPSHNHEFTSGGHAMCIYTNADPANQHSWGYVAGQNTGWYINANKNVADITYNGGNAAHNNMPPYKAVYIWERTA
nr:MAG TPA: Baseplate structural protein [Caudoviricetes sp.]